VEVISRRREELDSLSLMVGICLRVVGEVGKESLGKRGEGDQMVSRVDMVGGGRSRKQRKQGSRRKRCEVYIYIYKLHEGERVRMWRVIKAEGSDLWRRSKGVRECGV